jgi:hypothetical protein
VALERLEYGPCYNIREVAKNAGHTELWNNAIDGQTVDWDFLFTAYRSTVEWPAVAFLPQLIAHFPQAKVILTLREPESWYESAMATIFDSLEMSAHNPDPAKRERSGMNRRLILEQTFGGRYREKGYALEVYRRHNQLVVATVPPERLLQFQVKDGWEPLCNFLNRSIPDGPFP